MERAYRNLKRQEELLEASLGHISEEVKGGLSFPSASFRGRNRQYRQQQQSSPFLCMLCRVQ